VVPSSATQIIDISEGATEIDAGRLHFLLSGFLANGGIQAVSTFLKATLLDASGKTLLTYTITGPTAEESDATGNRMLCGRAAGDHRLPKLQDKYYVKSAGAGRSRKERSMIHLRPDAHFEFVPDH
jgi:hypothetical protein